MFLSELQTKDIISTIDGRKIGRIIDAKIDNQGKITSLVIETKKGIKNFIANGSDTTISFMDITKIGTDVILVNI